MWPYDQVGNHRSSSEVCSSLTVASSLAMEPKFLNISQICRTRYRPMREEKMQHFLSLCHELEQYVRRGDMLVVFFFETQVF